MYLRIRTPERLRGPGSPNRFFFAELIEKHENAMRRIIPHWLYCRHPESAALSSPEKRQFLTLLISEPNDSSEKKAANRGRKFGLENLVFFTLAE